MREIILKQATSFSLILFFALVVNGTERKTTTETLEATVVAYDLEKATTSCYRDCEGSLIVRIESAGNQGTRYARIDFKFRSSSSFPRQLLKQKRLWRFTVIRTQTLDEPIYEYVVQQRTSSSEEKKYRNWEMLPGAEDEKLPFGEALPSYELVGNKFRLVR
jgi:hypothetical protein